MNPTSSERVRPRATDTRSVAFVGLSVALLAVSAWITVPLGPVPFTLQTMVVVFCVSALSGRRATAAVGIYVLLGAVGLPLFSGMRGGIGAIMGPTGGFIWGFFAGTVAAVAVGVLIRNRAGSNESTTPGGRSHPIVCDVVAAIVLIGVCYLCGWLQLMAVAGMDAMQAFAVGIAPFIVLDAAKAAVAIVAAGAVRRALPRTK